MTTELVVSELVANVVRHARGPYRLRLLRSRSLVCEVFDGSLTTPRPRRASWSDEGGRGLQLIAALCDRWGTRNVATGKVIWTEQSLPGRLSAGPEPYPAMAAVAERLIGRCAAPAQRHPSVLPDQRMVLTEDRDVAADEQRAVRALLYRDRLRPRLLRPVVQAAEVQRARGTALDHLADVAR